jgi:hypothetical protein
MSQLTIKPRELPFIFAAIILLALIAEGYLDQHRWVILLTILAIPTWIILGRRKTAQTRRYTKDSRLGLLLMSSTYRNVAKVKNTTDRPASPRTIA